MKEEYLGNKRDNDLQVATSSSTTKYKGCILVVDDLLANTFVLSEMLSNHGYKVWTADNGKLALEALETVKPDLILMDICMPVMDGLKTCEILKKSDNLCDIPIIFISSLTAGDEIARTLDLGGVDFITKPFSKKEVLARIKTQMELLRLRQVSEKELLDSESKYQEVFNAVNEVIIIYEANTKRVIDINARGLELFGFGREQIQQMSAGDFSKNSPPYSSQDYVQYFEKALTDGGQTFDWQVQLNNGTVLWQEISLKRAMIYDREVVICVARDITERHNMIKQELALKTELEHIFDNSNPMCLSDADGTVLKVNIPFLDMFGTTMQEMVESKFRTSVNCSFRGTDKCCHSLCAAEVGYVKSNHKRQLKGKTVHYEVVCKPYKDDDGKVIGVLNIVRDITSLIKWEEDFRKQNQQLNHAARMASLGTLVAGVAHEINNPNNFIGLSGERLQKSWKDILPILQEKHDAEGDFAIGGLPFLIIKEEMAGILDSVVMGSERIANIVQSLRTFSGSSSSPLEQVDVSRAISQSATILSNLIKKSTDHFSVQCEDNLSKAWGSLQGLDQILVNVIQNACQSLSGRDKSIIVKGFLDQKIQRVVIEVVDQGQGICKENINQITDPFFTTKQEQGGMGLGLSICYGIVNDLGGKLKYTSHEGKGTVARIELLPSSNHPPHKER